MIQSWENLLCVNQLSVLTGGRSQPSNAMHLIALSIQLYSLPLGADVL